MEWPVNAGGAKRSWLVYLLIALFAATAGFFGPRVASRYLSTSTVHLNSVTTTGGGDVFEAPQTPALAKGIKQKTARTTVQPRPVVTYATETLPNTEREKIPDEPIRGADNVVRPPELTASAVVPPWRGETHARSYLLGDGRTEITLDPQREKFFGWEWRKLELEGGAGVGGKQFDATAGWYPLRLGNVRLGARADGWTEPDGTIKGAASIRVRWEPFR